MVHGLMGDNPEDQEALTQFPAVRGLHAWSRGIPGTPASGEGCGARAGDRQLDVAGHATGSLDAVSMWKHVNTGLNVG